MILKTEGKDIKAFTKKEAIEESTKYFNGDVMAAEVWVNKYALKDSAENIYELTPDDMHKRIAKEFARIEKKYKNPLEESEIFDLIKNFTYIVPHGSPMAGIGNNFQIMSISNCFVVGNDTDADSYGGILKLDQELVQLQKRRAGVGIDISFVRPEGSIVKNSALTSTGVVPFMERFSNSTKEVAQGGRRGALIESISIVHPDAEKFIDAKTQDGKVTSANISVKISDDFMEAALNGKTFKQQYPISGKNPKVLQEIDANVLWKKIIHNSWKCAEPGVLFWDTIIRESIPDCYADMGFKTVSTNPCFEGNQELLTEDGYKKFYELAELTKQKKCPKLINRHGKAVEGTVWSNGIKKVVELTIDYDKKIICTPNHKFATISDRDIEAKDSLTYRLISYSNTKFNKDYKCYENPVVVTGIQKLRELVEVFDFSLQDDCHWGVVNDIVAHNCGEIPLCPNDSCRLLAINLFSYVENPFTKEAKFNFDLFKVHANMAMRMMDDLVDLELEKIDSIIKKIQEDPEEDKIKRTEMELWYNIQKKTLQGRRAGLGITAEGDMLAALGLTYGTDKAIDFSEKVHKVLKLEAYRSSVEMAKERGNFEIWNPEKEKNNPFLKRIKEEDPELYKEMMTYGRRNIALLTIAPAGSVSVCTQTTSGIEPVFLPIYTRRRRINSQEKDIKIDFVDKQGDAWQEYLVFHHKFEIWLQANGYDVEEVKKMTSAEIKKIVEKSPYHKATSSDVDWVKKVEMQGRIQKNVDHSISCTVNLPADATEELVSKVYETGWKTGCKGLTVYREGSREGVLISNSEKKPCGCSEVNAAKRPKVVNSDVIQFQNNYEKWVAIIGKVDMDGNDRELPYELFTGKLDSFNIPTYVEKGRVIKRKEKNKDGEDVSIYDFRYIDKDGYPVEMAGLSRSFNKEYWNYAKLISGLLRHRMPIQHVANVVAGLKMDDADLNTWKNGVVRIINRYVRDGTQSKSTCEFCGANLVYSEGCLKCEACGKYSKCG